MKILGRSTTDYKINYIAEISADEINSIFNNSYRDKEYLRCESLKNGEDIDIASGYNFKRDIKDVCEKMIKSHESFQQASKTLYELSKLLVDYDDAPTTKKDTKGSTK